MDCNLGTRHKTIERRVVHPALVGELWESQLLLTCTKNLNHHGDMTMMTRESISVFWSSYHSSFLELLDLSAYSMLIITEMAVCVNYYSVSVKERNIVPSLLTYKVTHLAQMIILTLFWCFVSSLVTVQGQSGHNILKQQGSKSLHRNIS